MKNKLIHILLLILCTHIHTYAQYSLYPQHQSQVFNLVKSYNPSITNIRGTHELDFNYQQFLGPYKSINSKLFMANFDIGKDSSASKHNVGAKFVNEAEGDFISRTKLYLSYGWHLRIFKDYWLGSGIFMGLGNYSYKGTDAFTQGSDIAPDGDVGITFYRPDKLTIGISINQITNSIVQPKDLSFRWTRFYNFYINKNIGLNPNWDLNLYAQHLLRTDTYDITDLGTYFSYQKKILLGTNLTKGTKLSLLLGIQNINSKVGIISFMVNYNFPMISQTRTNLQALEFTLSYRPPRTF